MMRRRRGSMYVTVLAASTLVAVVGLSGLALSRIARRTSIGTNETVAARAYAQSAIEIALNSIASDKNWRTTYTHDVWTSDYAIGDGTYAFKLVDPESGSLTADTTAPVRVYGRGTSGEAVRMYSVLVTVTAGTPDNVLENADFESGTTSWSNYGSAALTASTIDPHGGSLCLYVSTRSSASAGPMQDVTADIQSAKTYQTDVWLKCETGTATFQLNLNLTLPDFSTTTYTVATGTVGTAWQLVTGTVSLPAFPGLYLGRFIIRTQSAKVNFFVDDAMLFEVGSETPIPTIVADTWRQEVTP